MIASVDAFTNKLTLLKRQLAREDITHFPLLKSLGKDCRLAQYYIPSIDRLIEQFTDHFVHFRRYHSEFDLISNPIIFNMVLNNCKCFPTLANQVHKSPFLN